MIEENVEYLGHVFTVHESNSLTSLVNGKREYYNDGHYVCLNCNIRSFIAKKFTAIKKYPRLLDRIVDVYAPNEADLTITCDEQIIKNIIE